ncbi:MAG: CHC2 zinc finger domain-containing protein [Isosphaerales bacterium]
MGMKAPDTTWEMTVPSGRIEWSEVKDRIDLGIVATALLGPAVKRSGPELIWMCPWDNDENPFLQVNPVKRLWKCWSCGQGGDAAALVMKVQGVAFPEAVRWLAEQVGIVTPSTRSATRPRPPAASKSARPPATPPEQPSGIPLADALALVEDARKRLWTCEGVGALEYLRGRGLEDESIRAAGLGFTPGVMIPKKDGTGSWKALGVTVPWFDGDRLALVKIRQPKGREPKYGEALRDRPRLFPAPAAVRPGRPLVVCEGEFDCLLLRQELADLDVGVVTMGSASARPGPAVLDVMLAAPVWYLALDADQAGDKNASTWPARARRVRPPDPFNDWTDLHQAGFNLIRYTWGRLIRRPISWEELSAQRWGPAIGDSAPGIIKGIPA